jgi:hypothetical protein
MEMIMDERTRIITADFIFTEKLEVKSEDRKNSAPVRKADQLKETEPELAQRNYNVEQLPVILSISSQENQVRTFKTVSIATQTFLDISDYDTIFLKLAQAVDRIDKLEEALFEKRILVTQLKNKNTKYRLREERNRKAKEDTLSDFKEQSNAQGEGGTEVGHNDSPVANDRPETDPGSNNDDTKQCVLQPLNTETLLDNQEHPQPEVRSDSSAHSNCIAAANSTENTSNTPTLPPTPHNDREKTVAAHGGLCAQLPRLLNRLTADSFSDALSEILALQVDAANIAAFAYMVHDKATQTNDSTQVMANLCQAVINSFHRKTRAKMKAILMERCLATFQNSHVLQGSRDNVQQNGQATGGEFDLSITNYEQALKQREKCIKSARFMGELWTAGIARTDVVNTFMNTLLNTGSDISLQCFCALANAVGAELEEYNDVLSKYYTKIEDMCNSSNGLSSDTKKNLQDLVQFRQQKSMQAGDTKRGKKETNSDCPPPAEADNAGRSNDGSLNLTAAGTKSAPSGKRRGRRCR